MSNQVVLQGLRELRGALAAVDRGLPLEFRGKLRSVSEVVAEATRGKIPRITGETAESVKAGATARGAYVKAGGGAIVWYGWLDFGGHVGIHASISRPRVPQGRYLDPTLAESTPMIQHETEAALDVVLARAGFL